MNRINWIARLIAAIVLCQTLFFKFSAAPESVFIFSQLGVEPYGRILSGIIELIAGILLIIPSTQLFGAIVALFVMMGALFSHLFVLGVVVQNDGGTLFGLAILVFCCSLFVMYNNRNSLKQFLKAVVKV